MCGIFGYANFNKKISMKEIFDILLLGLKRVEYRGYDSAGVCVDDILECHENVAPITAPSFVIRSVGNIDALREKVFSPDVAAQINMDALVENHVGISHTRWATHGAVCEKNAHPQQSNDGGFTVVHNGIMTNYMTVKQLLLDEGYHFVSETDTEVICVLAEYLYERKGIQDLHSLAMQITRFVEGAYALLIKSVHFPGQMIAARKGSPLLVGIRQVDRTGDVVRRNSIASIDPHLPLEVYFASDSNSFAGMTSTVVYLEDGDIVQYDNGSVKIFSEADVEAPMSPVTRSVETLETTLESLSKGAYPHFMLKEIFEQTESVIGSMRGRIDFAGRDATVHMGGFSQQNVRNILSSRRVLFISCGTSLNSCLAVRPLFEELVDIPMSVENASDFLDRSPAIHRDDVCVFVSQSGETADTLRVMEMCRENGALCVGVCNVVGSSISRQTDFGSHLNAGTEVGVASTKAYTSQVVVLTLIALLLSEDSVRHQQRRKEIITGLAGLSVKIGETLKMVNEPIKALAEKLKDAKSLIVLGRGFDYATALEAALKVKELSYVHTEGINSGELKHGPLALVDEFMTIFAVCSNDKHFARGKAAVQQVNARKGHVVVVTSNVDDPEIVASAGTVLAVPQTVDCLQCVVNVLPFQLLAYNMALARGNNVDCPRNLAKSVTVQ